MRGLFIPSVVIVFAACDDAGTRLSDAAPEADTASEYELAQPDTALADTEPMRELTFESLTPPLGGQFFAIAASPSTLLARSYGRFLRSDDGGETWRNQAGPVDCGGSPWLVAVGDDFFTDCGGVHVSGDAGETWSLVEGVGGFNAAEPATNGASLYWVVESGSVLRWNTETRAVDAIPTTASGFPGHVQTLAALGVDGPILYAASSRGSGWVDASAAATEWLPTNLPGYSNLQFAFGVGEGFAITPTQVLKRTADHMFVDVGSTMATGALDALLHDGRLYVSSSDGLLVSTDGGVNWATELPVRFDNRSGFAVLAGELYVASHEGLWARSSSGAWREIQAHSHIVERVVAVGDALLAFGNPGTSAQWRERAGADWDPIDLVGHYDLTPVGNTLFSTKEGAIHRLTNETRRFDALPNQPGSVTYITALSGSLVALVDRTFHVSQDNGESFAELGTAPAADYAFSLLMPVGETLLYWHGPKLYRSPDHMRTWERLPEPPGFAMRVALSDAIVASDFFGALFRSTDLGSTWTKVLLPVGVTRVAALEVQGSTLFAAAHHTSPPYGAIYTSDDLGATWHLLESETQSFQERARCLALVGDVLYIGTESTGLWAAHLPSAP